MNTVRRTRKSAIKDGGRQTGSTYSSACVLDSDAISAANPYFRSTAIRRTYCEYCPTYPEAGNQRWRTPKQKYLYLSLWARDFALHGIILSDLVDEVNSQSDLRVFSASCVCCTLLDCSLLRVLDGVLEFCAKHI